MNTLFPSSEETGRRRAFRLFHPSRAKPRLLRKPGSMQSRAWVSAVIAVGVVLSIASASALAQMTVKGDHAAWGDVAAAYKKLKSAPYRMKMTTAMGMQSVMEMVPPNKMRMTTQMPGGRGSMEVIRVGTRTAFRMNMPGMPSTWRCQSMKGMPAAIPQDPTRMHGIVDIVRGADTQIAGTPVHTYDSTMTDAALHMGPMKTVLYVATRTGLPLRSVTGTAKGAMTADYYDYGAPIAITFPPCGTP